MNSMAVYSTLQIGFENIGETEKVKTTFYDLNNNLDDVNLKGQTFLETMKNVNAESYYAKQNLHDISEFDATTDFVIKVDDPDNVLEKVENIENNNIPILTNPKPGANNGETPLAIKLSAIGAAAASGMIIGAAAGTIFPVIGNTIGGVIGGTLAAIFAAFVQYTSEESEKAIKEFNPEEIKENVFALGPIDVDKLSEGSEIAKLWANNLGEASEKAEQVKTSQEQLIEKTDAVTERTKNLNKEVAEQVGNMEGYATAIDKTKEAAQNFGEDGLPAIAEGAKEAETALSNIEFFDINEFITPEQISQIFDIPIEEVTDKTEQVGEGFEKSSESAKSSLDSLGVFAADIAANISDTFSDLLFNVFKGNFDSIGDLWKGLLDTMLRTFTDFAAGLITNPLRVTLEGSLRGDGSGGGGGGGVPGLGILSGVGDLFKEGGSLGFIGGLFRDGGALASIGNLFAEGGPLAFIGSIGKILGPIGAIASLAIGAFSIVKGLLKKSPRLDIDIGVIRSGVEKRAATVEEFLDPALLDDVVNISVKRKAGLGLGGDDPIQEAISDVITASIETIQDIINQLPADLAAQLNETLLNADIDIDSTIKGDKLLEFDETKKIAEKFQDFLEKDLPARFFASIRESFFDPALQALGVSADASQAYIDQFLEDLQGANREQRGQIGQEFIDNFQTLVDAYNVLNDNGVDSIGATVSSVQNLSKTLGFDAVPSIDELDRGLEELINAAELDPSVIQDYLDLRAAILQVQSAILSSISSIIGNISSLNSTIVSIGGSAVDLTGFINQGLDASLGILGQDGLSLDDQEAVLDQALGFANQLLAEEQAAFERAQQAAQKAAEARAEAQRAAVQSQIDGLEREKKLIDENFDARLEALEEELRIAEEFARLNESILQTLDSIIFSSESVFTAIERVGLAQSEIAGLQSELAGTSDPERQAEIAGQLEQAFDKLFGLAGEAFGVNSPEFVAIFDQVTGGLQDLADFTEGRTRSIEEINAEIEALNLERNQILENIDARIDAAQERLSSIQAENVQATFQASDRVRETLEFLRDEYLRIFEERMAQLDEVTAEGFETELSALSALVTVEEDSLIALRNIEAILSGAASFARGSGGIVDFGNGTLAFLHGREAVVPESQITPINEFSGALGDMNVNLNVNVNGGSDAAVLTVSNEIENMLVRSIRQGGKLRSAIQDAGARRMN